MYSLFLLDFMPTNGSLPQPASTLPGYIGVEDGAESYYGIAYALIRAERPFGSHNGDFATVAARSACSPKNSISSRVPTSVHSSGR